MLFTGLRQSLLERREEEANEAPSDSARQAALYKALLAVDPEALIARFEDPRVARDSECVALYLRAIYETDQVGRAAKVLAAGSGAAGDLPSGGSLLAQAPSVLGTRERPLYVVGAAAGRGWKIFWTAVGVVVLTSYGYAYFASPEGGSRIGGFSAKAHKYFTKETLERSYTFEDVRGCDEAKGELEDVVDFLKNPEKFNRLGAKMPKGVLLIGPPGTGKTLLAKAVAGEAGVPFLYASGSQFDEIFVGMGSMRIRQMFESAKAKAPAIIFIDEIDAIGSQRNARDPQHARMSLNQLLSEMDGFAENSGVVVIAATNLPDTLDSALLRPGRFDRHVHVPLPDVLGRRQILEMYLEDCAISSEVDTNVLARGIPGFSGAEIFKMVNQAKMHASASNGLLVTMHDLESAKDEMIMGSERKSAVISEQDRLITAYHESGHALVALKSKEAHPIHKATIIPRGRALGMVSQLPERDELSVSKAQLMARMDVAMGGRYAEELVFGLDRITTGASSDFQQASAIARAMVTNYGMSDAVGPLVLTSAADWETTSQETRRLIDAEVRRLLEESRERARAILEGHRRQLDVLAATLLEYETLNREDIECVLAGRPLARPPSSDEGALAHHGRSQRARRRAVPAEGGDGGASGGARTSPPKKAGRGIIGWSL